MKNNDLDVEKLLLEGASLDDLIKMKMEEELKEEFKKAAQVKPKKVYTSISDVPKDKIFSKEAVYRYFNRDSKSETFINGIQAEALVGIQQSVREKMLRGELGTFSTENAYVKFEKVVL